MTEHLSECPLAAACKHEYYNEPPIQCANCGESCICPDEERSGGLITRQRAEQIGRNIGKYGCVITEQQHLPECDAWDTDDDTIGDCICDRLRDCEQRVWKIAYGQGLGAGSDEHGQHEVGFVKGYAAALDAAHKAVASIKGEWVFGPRIYKHETLAAINALREEHK